MQCLRWNGDGCTVTPYPKLVLDILKFFRYGIYSEE